jgi:hypothetical protein
MVLIGGINGGGKPGRLIPFAPSGQADGVAGKWVSEWTAIPIGQMQVETGAGLKADGEQTEAAAHGEWRMEMRGLAGDGGRRAVCCMMKYPRSNTGQSPSRSPGGTTAQAPLLSQYQAGPAPNLFRRAFPVLI